jgi:AraC-like DNA-binding protein
MGDKLVSATPAALASDSLPTLKQALAGGLSQPWASADIGAQPSSPRRDPPVASGLYTGSERRDAVFPVELRSYAGGLRRTVLRRVLEHLQAHLDEELPVTALAAVADLSPSYFSRLFKRSTGLSPHQYLLRQRIERARELLADPGRRVAEVSCELGFPSQSHFTTVFRALAGVTPRAYQRRQSSK